MITPRRFHVFLFVLMAVVLGVIPLAAQQQQPPLTPDALPAPVPPAIFSAKKVFLSNSGADSGLFPHPFSGSQDRVYNQFYAAMQKWGRYDLVSDPDQADLVFELRLTSPNGPANPDKQKGASDPLPTFRLEIVDRKSHYTLWTVTESVMFAFLQKTHDRNFDDALNALLLDVQNLPKTSPPSSSAAK
ncbi:MAG TPA: hypothetical protein VGJ06_17360 [Candidatus Acidoferrum sp.]|jgi:hypothetical protein